MADPESGQTVALKAIQLSAFGEQAQALEKALLAEAEQASLTIAPTDGQAIASFVARVYQTPPAVAARAAQWLGRGTP